MNTVVLTGGGTAGHVIPALALLPYLRRDFGRIAYVGQRGGIEEQLAARYGLPFFGTRTIRFDRQKLWRNAAIPYVLATSAREVAEWLRAVDCRVLFSKGGYCAMPAVLAAHKCGIPIVCHESDRTLGLANRVSRLYTSHILTSFDTTRGGVCVGNPIRDEMTMGVPTRTIPLADGPVVLVMGGSMGALSLNRMAVELAAASPSWQIVNLYGRSPVTPRSPNYHGLAFVDNVADYYARADVVVCRAGANTLFELAAVAKPVVTVPLPKSDTSRGDQVQNAAYFADRYGFRVIAERDMTTAGMADAVRAAMEQGCGQRAESHAANRRIADYLAMVAREGAEAAAIRPQNPRD